MIIWEKTYFIADLHFGHKNCLSYDCRPFATIEDQDEFIISKWNSKIEPDDEVYIIGDVSWYNVTKTINILKTLNGQKHLIIGNHDHHFLKNASFRECFIEITHYKEIELDSTHGIVLSHYPIPCFNKHYYGWVHFYGHVHKSFEWEMMERIKYEMEELYSKPAEMYNVGIMVPYMNWEPQTIEDIRNRYKVWKDIFKKKE